MAPTLFAALFLTTLALRPEPLALPSVAEDPTPVCPQEPTPILDWSPHGAAALHSAKRVLHIPTHVLGADDALAIWTRLQRHVLGNVAVLNHDYIHVFVPREQVVHSGRAYVSLILHTHENPPIQDAPAETPKTAAMLSAVLTKLQAQQESADPRFSRNLHALSKIVAGVHGPAWQAARLEHLYLHMHPPALPHASIESFVAEAMPAIRTRCFWNATALLSPEDMGSRYKLLDLWDQHLADLPLFEACLPHTDRVQRTRLVAASHHRKIVELFFRTFTPERAIHELVEQINRDSILLASAQSFLARAQQENSHNDRDENYTKYFATPDSARDGECAQITHSGVEEILVRMRVLSPPAAEHNASTANHDASPLHRAAAHAIVFLAAFLAALWSSFVSRIS